MKKVSFIATILAAVLTACVKEIQTSQSTVSSQQVSNGKPAPAPSILQWQKTYGSSADDIGYAMANNSTGDAYFIAGYTNGNNLDVAGNHGGRDAWIVKDGVLSWQIAIGGAALDEANAVVATEDGGCLVAGYTQSTDGDFNSNHGGGDALLVKLTDLRAVEWKRTLGGSGYDRAWALISTLDGGFAMAGQTTSSDGDLAGIPGLNDNLSKVWLIKFDEAANIEWQKTFAVNGSKDDVGYSITQTADGGYIVAGRTLSASNNADIYVISVNSTGAVNWTKTIGSASGGGDVAWAVTTSPANDGCVITGYMGALNLVVIKLDNGGGTTWQKTFSGSNSGGIQGRAILATGQGYLITGVTASRNGDIIASKGNEDMFVLRIDAGGNKISSSVLGGSGYDGSRSMVASSDGTYLAVGYTSSNNGDVSGNHGLYDIWVVRFKFQ